ncbi:MAG: sigma-70 family RNA polymerase sigma factor [Candidatus Ratteibacteria bacterium]
MNEADFEIIVRENQERIYRLALRIVGNKEEAKDITQETFLAAYEHQGRFRREANFSTYIYRIALNFAFRALKRKRPVQTLEKPETIRSKDENPAQIFQREEKEADIQRLLDFLPPRQKAVVHLRLYENLSFIEVARVLGCRPATARTHYFFGLQNLRKEMKASHEL